jgi:hypothetical protein
MAARRQRKWKNPADPSTGGLIFSICHRRNGDSTPGADAGRLAIKQRANKNPADLSTGGVIFSIRQHLRRRFYPPARL